MASILSVQHKIYYGLAPTIEEGPRKIYKQYIAAAAGEIADNLTKEIQMKEISFIQGCYFDNKAGGGIITLISRQAELSIEIANKTQGFLPLMWPQEPEFSVIFAAAGTFNIHFLNVPVAPYIWATT